jgi:hypothetical protein
MKLISHRGNIIGPNPNRENSPSYIDTAISAGYEVEVDINYMNGKFYLGHDTPDYEITEQWMTKRRDNIWFHCKNLDAATHLSEISSKFQPLEFNFFCHTSDSFVMTSTNHIWVHDLTMNLSKKCIIPLLSDVDIINYKGGLVYAVCTDYITLAEFNLKQKGLFK